MMDNAMAAIFSLPHRRRQGKQSQPPLQSGEREQRRFGNFALVQKLHTNPVRLGSICDAQFGGKFSDPQSINSLILWLEGTLLVIGMLSSSQSQASFRH
jgi:hypothetical protein